MPVAPAAVGAAVFCLFPADTTKILLTHDFQLQPSLTFALLAGLAYAAGRRPLAYVVSAGALLSYENGFLALFALPLFVRRWDRSLPRALLVHAAAVWSASWRWSSWRASPAARAARPTSVGRPRRDRAAVPGFAGARPGAQPGGACSTVR